MATSNRFQTLIWHRQYLYTCNVTVYVGLRDDFDARCSPTYRRVYASTGSVIRSLESRFRGQKSTQQLSGPHLINGARLYSSKERRLIEPGLTGARVNALARPALVYNKFGSCLYGMGYLFFLSQLTNVNRFNKG